ncbi:MAG: magnesium chelatase domain-containing protein [Verrucomicrobiota bacterium]|jgi:hypothetical protein
MLARVLSAAVDGIEALPVEVEVNSGWSDTLTVIVGLPDAAVKESRDGDSRALTNSGFKFPMERVRLEVASMPDYYDWLLWKLRWQKTWKTFFRRKFVKASAQMRASWSTTFFEPSATNS